MINLDMILYSVDREKEEPSPDDKPCSKCEKYDHPELVRS